MLLKRPLVLFYNKPTNYAYRHILRDTFKVHQDFDPIVGIYRHIWNVPPSILLKCLNLIQQQSTFAAMFFFRISALGFSSGTSEFFKFFYLFIYFTSTVIYGNGKLLQELKHSRNKAKQRVFVLFLQWLREFTSNPARMKGLPCNTLVSKTDKKLFIYLFKPIYFMYVLHVTGYRMHYTKFFKSYWLAPEVADKKLRTEKTHGRLKNFPIFDINLFEFSFIVTEANLMDMLFIMEREEVKKAFVYEDDEKGRPIVWLFTPNSKKGEYDMGSRDDFEYFFRDLVVVNQETEKDVWNLHESSISMRTMYVFKVFPKVIRRVYHESTQVSFESSLAAEVVRMHSSNSLLKPSLLTTFKNNLFLASLESNNQKKFFSLRRQASNLHTAQKKGVTRAASVFSKAESFAYTFNAADPLPDEEFIFKRDALSSWELVRFKRHLLSIILIWFIYRETRLNNFIFSSNSKKFFIFNYRFSFYRLLFFWVIKHFGWPRYPSVFQVRMFCRVSLGTLRLVVFDTLRNYNRLTSVFPNSFKYTQVPYVTRENVSLLVGTGAFTSKISVLSLNFNYNLLSFFYLFRNDIIKYSYNYWNYMYYYILESVNFHGSSKDPFALDLELRSLPWARNFFGVIRRTHNSIWFRYAIFLQNSVALQALLLFLWMLRFNRLYDSFGTPILGFITPGPAVLYGTDYLLITTRWLLPVVFMYRRSSYRVKKLPWRFRIAIFRARSDKVFSIPLDTFSSSLSGNLYFTSRIV